LILVQKNKKEDLAGINRERLRVDRFSHRRKGFSRRLPPGCRPYLPEAANFAVNYYVSFSIRLAAFLRREIFGGERRQ